MSKYFQPVFISNSDIHYQDISVKPCIIVMIQYLMNAQREMRPNTNQQMKNNMILGYRFSSL